MLHGLAVLHADFGVHAVDEELAKDLVNVVKREARGMTSQAVGNIFNALGKIDAAAAEISTSGWGALARAAEGVAPKMEPQAVAMTLQAYGKLPTAAAELSASGRERLEAAAEREASNMTSQGRQMTLSGCEKLGIKIPPALRRK